MSIYVDRLFMAVAQGSQARRVGARNHHRWCHMFTDGDEAELVAFAKRIGLKADWIQRGSVTHFDVTPLKREAAIAAGAIEVDRRRAVAIWHAWRLTHGSGS